MHLHFKLLRPFSRKLQFFKRKLLNFVCSNSTWKDHTLTATFRQPFDVLALRQLSFRGVSVNNGSFQAVFTLARIFRAPLRTTGICTLVVPKLGTSAFLLRLFELAGAGGRTRTDMRSEPRQILSLVRIPISPLRREGMDMIRPFRMQRNFTSRQTDPRRHRSSL